MTEALVLISVLLTLLILRRQGVLAPASVFALIATVTLVTFYVFEVLQLYPNTISTFWQIRQNFDTQVPSVAVFYTGLVLIALCAHLATARVRPTASSDFSAERYLFRMLRSPITALGLFSLLALVVLHLLVVDLSAMLHFREYFGIRDPAVVGIGNPILGLLHTNIPLVGCAAAALTVVYLRDRRYLLLAAAAGVFAYSLAVSLAFGSRFAVLQIVAAAMMFQVLNPGKVDRRAVVLSAVAGFVFLALISLRRNTTMAHIGDYGLLPLLDALLLGPDLLFAGIPSFIALTFFGGGFVMAKAFTMHDLYYPLEYEILSYSPLPSLIDGFDAIRHVQHKADTFAPFSNFAEVFHFGPLHFAGFMLFVLLALVLLNHFWRRFHGAFAFFIVAPAYFAFAKMHLYQLRSTLRWLLASLIIAAIFEVLVLLHRQRVAARSKGPHAPDARIPSTRNVQPSYS